MLLHKFIGISIFVIQAFILQTKRFFSVDWLICIFCFFEFFGANLFLGAHRAFHSTHPKQALKGNVVQNGKI